MAHEVAYIYDDALRLAANAEGENYWYCYVAEILDTLGARADPVRPAALAGGKDSLSGRRVLIMGDCDASLLQQGAQAVLRDWVASGGIVIGFKTTGLDDLFGIASAEVPDIQAEPYTIAGWMSLNGEDEASGLLEGRLPATLCPIMSPFRHISLKEAVGLSELAAADPQKSACPRSLDEPSPAVTRRDLVAGRAYYFAFNLPQAVWTYRRGRPVTEDVDGDGYLRISDAIIVPSGAVSTVPCADMLLLILENIIARAGVPFIHQLPPMRGSVPDAVFHYGGDDEARDGLQAKMSELMKSLGLPYHINVMLRGGRFHFTDEDRALYEKNGHEFSLHCSIIQEVRNLRL